MNEKKLNEAVKERMLKAMLLGFEGGRGGSEMYGRRGSRKGIVPGMEMKERWEREGRGGRGWMA